MKKYIEEVLHQTIDLTPYDEHNKLPLSCRNVFKLNVVNMGMKEYLTAEPINSLNLTELRKMRIQLERFTGYNCVFYLKMMNWYAVSKMIEEGIPFVWEGHQIYLPFLGISLDWNAPRTLRPCDCLSFLTQKLLLKAIYENWQNISATEAAKFLGVSKMSVTRCYDEIEAIGIPLIKVQGRSRKLQTSANRKETWDIIKPFLRNPVIRIFRLEKKPEAEMISGGTSALSLYTLLEEDERATYAVTKKQVASLGIKSIREVPFGEEPDCTVQEMGYIVPFGGYNAIDPLSLILTLTDEELSDPRIENSINEMLEEFVW